MRRRLLVLGLLALSPFAMAQDDDEEPVELQIVDPSPAIRFSRVQVTGELAATPGGAQDIRYFRDRVEAGEVPLPQTFTPEGLFSEHDLPIEARDTCDRLLCVFGESTPASLLVQEDVAYLAQIGFSSVLDESFERPPLNLVAVVDKSGSMSGPPIDTVRKSLLEVVDHHLRKGDQLSIVVYGSDVSVLLSPTTDRSAMRRGIRSIEIQGSTNLEAGLGRGFELAESTRRTFDGVTRVMLFTDERPNTGRTDAAGFMGQAEAASEKGIGLTTVGVGVQFGAELATKVSSVRGGNLFYFASYDEMRETFAEDFDTMVVELAYDMEMEVSAAPGLRVAGIYGIPGEAIEWTDDGALRLEIATLFLSRRSGAIYVAFASDHRMGTPATRVAEGSELGRVFLDYEARDRDTGPQTVPLTVTADPGIGLRRGQVLVDEVTTLKHATELHHHDNDQEGAYQAVHQLASILRSNRDPALEPERKLVFELEDTLAFLSGHRGEGTEELRSQLDPVTGLPR